MSGWRTGKWLKLGVAHTDATLLVDFILNRGAWLEIYVKPSTYITTKNYELNFEKQGIQYFSFFFGASEEGKVVPADYRACLKLWLRGIKAYGDVEVLYISNLSASPLPEELKVTWRAIDRFINRTFFRLKPVSEPNSVVHLGPAAFEWRKEPNRYVVKDWEVLPREDIQPELHGKPIDAECKEMGRPRDA